MLAEEHYRDEGMIGYLHMELYCAINKFYILHGRVSQMGCQPVRGSHTQMTQLEYAFASGSETRPWNFLGKRVLQV